MFTVGTDTEFFLEREGRLISAIDLIKAGKHYPQPLASGGNITHDNVAMEYATPVANDEESFVKAIKDTMKESLALLPTGVTLNTKASADFPEEELDHEEARMFGCDPDFDAWAIAINAPPPNAAYAPFRCVGGHLHIGYVENSGNEFLLDGMGKIDFVKVLDVLLGIPFVILDSSQETINRRKLYGKAGCHRPTYYGVEYRALSNFWTFSPVLVRLVYSLAAQAINLYKEGSVQQLIETLGSKEIQRVINKGDKKKALAVWSKHIAPLLPVEVVSKFEQAMNKKEYDLYQEWGL